MPGLPLHSLRDVWENTVHKFSRKPAIIFNNQSHRFAEIDRQSALLAAQLHARCGVQPGDRVAIAMPNCLEFYLAYWAILRLGAVLAPVNIRPGPTEMTYVINNTGAQVLFLHADTREVVEPALSGAKHLRFIVSVGFQTEDTLPFEDLLTGDGPSPGPTSPRRTWPSSPTPPAPPACPKGP